jgi:hypothetical protein
MELLKLYLESFEVGMLLQERSWALLVEPNQPHTFYIS